ncbi:MAG: hypothetical protein A3K19_15965 [Lentisphaerae bacterium RIFOXYB12_FULL_65_16]|nr:MAG: hypothetical protein A3K18_06110 [Lentisphaerae bacterium RIFOXYA12_64_32]OGV87321.1 MAG: hypothetical protein A3K19_15965 [Lentisphaerae bacterium RIFOXYB12_FULL_65_16]
MSDDASTKRGLSVRHEPHRLQVVRVESGAPILVQHAAADNRPYIHPLLAPDGKGCLTEDQPWHHLWQHGIYTGLHGVNGVDFWTEGLSRGGLEHDGTFHPRPLATPRAEGNIACWQVEAAWRAPQAADILIERQSWWFEDLGSAYRLDLDWELQACTDVTFDACAYGGLFLRMPWRPELTAMAVDSDGRGRAEAEGKRSRWVAVSMPLPGRPTHAGIAVLDHPGNPVHPTPWRVDGNYGISPSRCILGGWQLRSGERACERYRLFVFCGEVNPEVVEHEWLRFAANP